MELTSLVTLLAVLLTFWLSIKVGNLRGEAEIKAPAITGNAAFERAFRVHANTIEQLVLFLPSLWLARPVLGDAIAAAIGLVWIIGRLVYARGYMEDPAKRGPGMMTTFLAMAALWVAALVGVFGGTMAL